MAKKKSAIEKVVEAVDHIIHPEKPVESEAEVSQANDSAPAPEKSSSEQSDYAKHPKFDKFKAQGEKLK